MDYYIEITDLQRGYDWVSDICKANCYTSVVNKIMAALTDGLSLAIEIDDNTVILGPKILENCVIEIIVVKEEGLL